MKMDVYTNMSVTSDVRMWNENGIVMWYDCVDNNMWFLENKRIELSTSMQGKVNVLYLAMDRLRTEHVTI